MQTIQHSVENSGQLIDDNHINLLLGNLYELLGVKIVGNKTRSLQGCTTTHIMQETDKGKLCIRLYPKQKQQKMETGQPLFEIEALNFFVMFGFNVPVPLIFGDKYYYDTTNEIIFSYFLVPGIPISRSELSIDMATKIGIYLCKFLEVTCSYSSEEHSFINSFEYILRIAAITENLHSNVTELAIWRTMKEHTEANVNILCGTPKGIVHADYFYENILRDDNGNVIGLIDFGDAYYGHILHDAAIGAMEASILDGELWNLEIFSSFLNAIRPFLQSNAINFEQFFETMKVDCFRFALYTFQMTLNRGNSFSDNAYVSRYKTLSSKEFEGKLENIFQNIVNT